MNNKDIKKILIKETRYTDCYNLGIQYLRKQLGVNRRFGGHESYNIQKAEENPHLFSDEILIHTLLGQYNYGIAAKQDLHKVLTRLGVNCE